MRIRIRRRGFTDKLYFLNLLLVWTFVLICIVITLLSGFLGISDLSIISAGIPTAFGELSIHTGLIVWKAKCENMKKFNSEDNIMRRFYI